ncbi:MAG: cupin domain-containing protein [Anaerolineales bacterium]
MTRQLFTAADIRRLMREQRTSTLLLGADDLITPEAVDQAGALGLEIIRQALTAPNPPAQSHNLPPLKVVRGAGVALEPFGEGLASLGTNVRLMDVVISEDGSPMAAGYMALEAAASSGGEFPWTLTYDEVDIVLEGELVITRGREVVRGGPGDVIFIPKGSNITFGTPSRTRFVYVAFPANWNG